MSGHNKLTGFDDVPNLSFEDLYKVAIAIANRILPYDIHSIADPEILKPYIETGMTIEHLFGAVNQAIKNHISPHKMKKVNENLASPTLVRVGFSKSQNGGSSVNDFSFDVEYGDKGNELELIGIDRVVSRISQFVQVANSKGESVYVTFPANEEIIKYLNANHYSNLARNFYKNSNTHSLFFPPASIQESITMKKVNENKECPSKKIKLSVRKNSDTGEWMVKYYENGEYSESKTYYTDDKADAVATAKSMKAKLEKKEGVTVTLKESYDGTDATQFSLDQSYNQNAWDSEKVIKIMTSKDGTRLMNPEKIVSALERIGWSRSKMDYVISFALHHIDELESKSPHISDREYKDHLGIVYEIVAPDNWELEAPDALDRKFDDTLNYESTNSDFMKYNKQISAQIVQNVLEDDYATANKNLEALVMKVVEGQLREEAKQLNEGWWDRTVASAKGKGAEYGSKFRNIKRGAKGAWDAVSKVAQGDPKGAGDAFYGIAKDTEDSQAVGQREKSLSVYNSVKKDLQHLYSNDPSDNARNYKIGQILKDLRIVLGLNAKRTPTKNI